MKIQKMKCPGTKLLLITAVSLFLLSACGNGEEPASSAQPSVVVRKKAPVPAAAPKPEPPQKIVAAAKKPTAQPLPHLLDETSLEKNSIETPPVKDIQPQVKPNSKAAVSGKNDNPASAGNKKQQSFTAKAPVPEKKPAPAKSLKKHPMETGGKYTVQVGAFKSQLNCEMYAVKLKNRGYAPYVITIPQGKNTWHVVKLGRYKNKDDAFEVVEHFMETENKEALVTFAGTILNVPRN